MIYLLETHSNNPFYNLAFEEYFFLKKPTGITFVILWQNQDTVVVGKHQNIFDEIDLDYAKQHNIQIVRRNSGGGSVFHDLGNLNYTFLLDRPSKYETRQFSLPILQALTQIGIKAEFTGRNDLCVQGAKISGTAQYIQGNKILHHGTLLIHSNLDKLSRVLCSKTKITDSRAAHSHKSRVRNLEDILGLKLDIPTIKSAIFNQFSDALPYVPTEQDKKSIELLVREKYQTPQWNYHFIPPCNFTNRKRFAGGTVEVHTQIEQGCIKHIEFRGDFFTKKDIHQLEQSLVETNVLSQLTNALQICQADSYIEQVSAEDIASLFEVFTMRD